MTNKDSVGNFHTANFLNMYDSIKYKLHMQLELLNFCSLIVAMQHQNGLSVIAQSCI